MMRNTPETPGTTLLLSSRRLTLDDITQALQPLPVPVSIEDGFLVMRQSLRGWTLRNPVKVPLDKAMAAKERGLVTYIYRSFGSERPGLIPWVFENQSLLKLARHFLRKYTGSAMTLYTYVDTLSRYSRFLEHSPDTIIHDVLAGGNIPDIIKVRNHTGFLEDYLAQLQDDGLSRGRVHACIKHIKTFYRTNGIKDITLDIPVSRRVTFRDRSPTADELSKLLDIATLREKVIVSMQALGAYREGTLSKLEYRHVKEDLENGSSIIHIHLEAEIVKEQHADFDTFVGGEAPMYLQLYLHARRQGNPRWRKGATHDRLPPEEISDTSPIVRDEASKIPRNVTPKQIRRITHQLYARGGLLKQPKGRMYELRNHSLRKYFKTQMLARGVQEPIVDYFMAHKNDTYVDIESLGVEKLRNIYAAANLSIRPETKAGKTELLRIIKEMIRAHGENPEQILSREAMSEPTARRIDGEDYVDEHLKRLALKLESILGHTQGKEPLQVE
jgi:hypothetical protein